MIRYFRSINAIYSINKIVIFTLFFTVAFHSIYLIMSLNAIEYVGLIDVYLAIILITILTILFFVFVIEQTLKNKSINFVDVYSLIVFLSLILNIMISFLSFDNYDNSWLYFLLFSSGFIFVYIFIRIFYTSKANNEIGNLMDFKDLYEGKIDQIDKNRIIVFEEKKVDYDLLKRDRVVNQLYESIQHVTPQSKLIVGLEGEWGSGKSTILNLVKNELKKKQTNCIVIDEFDPWHFNDEKSMLEAILENIISKVKLGLPNLKSALMIKDFVNNIFEKNGFSLFNSMISKSSNIYDSTITKIINDYLFDNDKKIVFIIDNLDRTQKEHIFFIYKALASLINIDRIVFILAYDYEVVSKALKDLNIEDKYLEKIIQLKLLCSR